jgi:tape measure domain-containing protein
LANNVLKATVRINSDPAITALKRLEQKIRVVQRTIDRNSNKQNNFNNTLKRSATLAGQFNTKLNASVNATKQLNAGLKQSHRTLQSMDSSAGSFLAKIGGAYAIAAGLKLAITTSDEITAAENQLNALTGYDKNATNRYMDAMYVAAQNSRSDYGDMMKNVGKSMTLAGDSFNDNIYNAIRFQEIMNKAYAISGATEGMKSSSMYQLVQALGSGVLQGDELKSVAEGATLAYQKIEEFAQGIYGADKNLKDLASEGKITSDIVVAAIMSSGAAIDEAFAKTDKTAGQLWTGLKNTAKQAFRPVQDEINKIINSDTFEKIVDDLTWMMTISGKALAWVMHGVAIAVDWIGQNWEWVKYIIISGLILISSLLIAMAARAVACIGIMIGRFIAAHPVLMSIVAVLSLVVAGLGWIASTAKDTCDFLVKASLFLTGVIIACAIAIYIATGNVIALIVAAFVAAVLVAIALFISFIEFFVALAYSAGAVIINIITAIKTGWHVMCTTFSVLLDNTINAICQLFHSLGSFAAAIFLNIGIAWHNFCVDMQTGFYKTIAAILDMFAWLEGPINAIGWMFGVEVDIDGAANEFKAKAEKAWGERREYIDPSAEFSKTWDSYNDKYRDLAPEVINASLKYADEYKDVGQAWGAGWNVGASWREKINAWGESVKNKFNQGGFWDKLGGQALPYDYDAGALGDIADDTDKISKTIDKISDEDMTYLRKIAELEWKKEYTTNEIKINMTNNNNVNGTNDLDGLVTKLSSKLQEELEYLTDGVYR